MPKKFIAWVLAVVMTSQMITPVISYGGEGDTGASAVDIEDSVSSGSSIVIEEPTEITAEPTEIYSSSSSSDTEEIISADFSEEGSCGDNVTYYYDSDTGTLTISGTGAMTDYSSSLNVPWHSVNDKITSVIIEDGITTIGKCAFYACSGLPSVTIPGSVTTIGYEAFCGCSSLSSITIPDSVTTIGYEAFYGCSSLVNVTVPKSVTTIGEYTFMGCGFKTAGPIGGGYDFEFGWTEKIPEYAFKGCSNLNDITFPDELTFIDNHAFYSCSSLTSLDFPDSLTLIAYSAFNSCSGLTSITFPDNLETINGYAFKNCYSLTNLVIPEKVTDIDDYTFYDCKGLTSVTLPYGITNIGSYAFYGCSSLASINLPISVTSIGSYAFSGCTNLVLYVYAGSYAEEYAINNNKTYVIMGNEITVNITDENKETISTDLYSVNWYKEGEDEVIAEGSTLSGTASGSVYEYEIILDSSIGKTYYQPERTEVTAAGEDITIDVQLELITTVNVSGKVTDSSGKAVSGASVTFTQTINGLYTEYVYTTTAEDGSYSAEILNVPTIVSISDDNYYTSKKSVLTAKSDSEEIVIDTIAMAELPSDRVTLSLQKVSAAAEGEEAYTSYVTNFNNLTFTVYNESQSKNVTGFTAQYPYLVFNEGAVSAGNTLTISVSDSSGETTCSDVRVVLDDDSCGEAVLELVENGKISLSGISGNDSATVIVFDENGDLVKSYSAETYLLTDPMTAGSYQLALFTKTTLLKSVSNISKLSEMGLSAGTDYTSLSASVSNGVITEISDISVPVLDETKLYYTVSENTTLFASSNSVIAGRYFSISVKYEIDSKYSSSNEKVEVELPEGVSFVSNSLTLNGSLSTYSYSNNVVSVNANGSSGIVRFCAVGITEGNYDICGYLSFDNGSDSVTQPIGSTTLSVSEAEIEVMSKTNLTTVPVSGIALANSKITVYDNYEVVGTTTSNSNGSWSLYIDLYKPFSFSYHLIYAEIENSDFSETIKTDEQYLVYNQNYIQLSKITMYNTAHPTSVVVPVEYSTEFDYLDISTVEPNYSYWPSYPTFTFKVEFADGMAAYAENVYVITTDSYNEETYVECEYVANEDAWIGTYDYTAFEYAPVSVTAAYHEAFDVAITVSNEMLEYGETYFEELNETLEEFIQVGDMESTTLLDNSSDGSEDKLIHYIINDDEDDEASYDTYSYYTVSSISSDSSVDYTDLVYIEYGDGNEVYYDYVVNDDEDVITLIIYDVSNDTKYTIYGSGNISSILNEAGIESSSVDMAELVLDESVLADMSTLGDVLSIGAIALGAVSIGLVLTGAGVAAIAAVGIVSIVAGLGSMIETDKDMDKIGEKLKKYKELNPSCYDEMSIRLGRMQSGNRAFGFSGALLSSGSVAYAGWSSVLLGIESIVLGAVGIKISKLTEQLDRDIDNKCKPTYPTTHYPSRKPRKKADPSGYVYEAVPSNRLEGVTTTIYYSGEVLDNYGISTGTTTSVLWDAEDYDEINPQTTDANGEYGWDVPEGSWQVKYEKSGYTTAYSEWLPVPPPQFDVNQALVATTAPSVENVNVYSDEIQIIFSKYMKLSAADTITVTINGETIEGTVTADNAEYNGDETEEYASIFIFTPTEDISGEATVTIAAAEGYNGLMSSEYTVTKTAVVRPKYINSAESIDVKYNSGALLEVEILPHEAAEGLVLEASTASGSIAAVTNETVTFDSGGTANVMLNGELMGQTVLTLSIQGTDLTKTVTVNVLTNAAESSKCAKVTANIESGSTVESGTELVLSTETEGAEIYYTLDGTCPCTIGSESRLLYTGSLTLTEDTFIIAYAVKDGYDDSNTAGFIYTIAGSEESTEESTEASTETSTETTSEATTEVATETTTKTAETTTAETTTETTTKAASSSSSGGGGGGGSSSTCTIKLVPNNGVNSSTKYVKKNSTLAEPDTPVYDGYTFTGWYTDSDCTTLYDFSAKVTSSFTLYGGWKVSGEDESDGNETEAEEETKEEESQTETKESVIEKIVKVVIGSTTVTVETDGKESTYTMDTAPYIQSESSSTLVPLRFVAVAVYGDEVDNADSSDIVAWDSATKTATISVGNDTISFTAGSEYMSINGKNVLMSNGVKAEITDGRMFIPFRALGEALGVEVDWDSTTKTAIYTAG